MLDQSLPWRTTPPVISDDRRRTDASVLDHRPLCWDSNDASPDLQNPAMTSPMLQLALIAMPTIVIRDLRSTPSTLYKGTSPSPFEHRTIFPTSH